MNWFLNNKALEEQEKLLFKISPDDIGIRLTDGFMLGPGDSVTSRVVAYPFARYLMCCD
jgi:5-methyltetrahydrofolate--homocysteine methyltransferase